MTAPRPVRGEGGSVAVEVAVIAPAFVFLMLLVTFAGRVSATDAAVARASAEAARSASLRQHPTDAAADARATAAANLDTAGVDCARLQVAVDTADFHAGGTVAVTVECDVPLSDIAAVGAPGERRFTGSAVEVIDRYRGGTP